MEQIDSGLASIAGPLFGLAFFAIVADLLAALH